MEAEEVQMGGVGEAHQVTRRTNWRGAAVKVRGQEAPKRGRLLETDRAGRGSRKLGIAIEGAGLRLEKAK